MADFLNAGANIARDSINGVSIIPAVVVGLVTALILGPLAGYGGYKLAEDNTCPEDNKENCVNNPWIVAVVLVFFAIVVSIMLGRFVYLVMFSIENPKLAAGIFATGMVSSAIRG